MLLFCVTVAKRCDILLHIRHRVLWSDVFSGQAARISRQIVWVVHGAAALALSCRKPASRSYRQS